MISQPASLNRVFGVTAVYLSIGLCGCSSSESPPSKSPETFIDSITVNSGNKQQTDAAPPYSDKPENELTGADILQRSHQAYAKLKTYKGTILSNSAVGFGTNTLKLSLQAIIVFQAPAKFRFEGKDDNRDPYVIICDGKDTWSSPFVKGRKLHYELGKTAGIRDSLAEFLGATNSMTAMLPAILMQVAPTLPRGKKLLPAFATKATLDGEETIDGHRCYRVVCERDVGRWTFWVDTEIFLFRRLERLKSPKHMAFRRKGSSGHDAVDRISSRRTIENYEIESIDAELDEALFQVPAR